MRLHQHQRQQELMRSRRAACMRQQKRSNRRRSVGVGPAEDACCGESKHLSYLMLRRGSGGPALLLAGPSHLLMGVPAAQRRSPRRTCGSCCMRA